MVAIMQPTPENDDNEAPVSKTGVSFVFLVHSDERRET